VKKGMSYVERKRRSMRSIRSKIKRTVKELKEAVAEGVDTGKMEEKLHKLLRSKYELSQRVRFRSS
jgi:ribosomal protein S20